MTREERQRQLARRILRVFDMACAIVEARDLYDEYSARKWWQAKLIREKLLAQIAAIQEAGKS